MTDNLIRNLRDLAAFAHADLSVADEAADEIERLREALRINLFFAEQIADAVNAARAALGESERQ